MSTGNQERAFFSRQQIIILAICCMSLLMANIDSSAVNIALPSLQRDMDASIHGLQWVIDAYTLILASFVMLAGSTADRFGRRRIFSFGLSLFTVASAACGFAPGLGWLIGFRVLQAVGASMLTPVAMSIISDTFTGPSRARAIGLCGAVVGVSVAGGPLLGGVMVESMGWHSIFWLNLPVGLLALLLIARYMPESQALHPRRADPIGQGLVILALVSLSFGVIEGSESASFVRPACFVVAILAVVALIGYELQHREPLLELRYFRSAPFGGAAIVAVVAFASLGGFLFSSTLYLQKVRELDALTAGLYLLPVALTIAICAPISGFLTGRWGARIPFVIAGLGIITGAVVIASFDVDNSNPLLFTAYTSFGVGFGFVNPPITNSAISEMPKSRSGVAAGIASSCRHLGSSMGVAVVGALIAADSRAVAWWVIASCGGLVFFLGILITGKWAKDSAQRTATELNELSADA
ncbi:MFS transporter [Streptomyces qinglanensis]|uniref:MFS transporter n=1 Tax=Streptomyces qinglanensis TaxID=943816 RepID=UPI00379C59CF